MQRFTERLTDWFRNFDWSPERLVLVGLMVPVWLVVIGLIAVTLLKDNPQQAQPAVVRMQSVAPPSSASSQAQATEKSMALPATTSTEAEFLLDVEVVNRYVWPATGPLTSYFGPGHPLGIDIGLAYDEDSPIRAAAAGTVVFAGSDCCTYGKYVEIKHEDGFTSLYAHLSEIDVYEDQRVQQGDLLGRGGDTGDSDGKHLHFELHDTVGLVDPLRYLPADQVPAQRVLACPSRTIFVDPASQLWMRFTSATLAETQVTRLQVTPRDPFPAAPAARAAYDRTQAVIVDFDAPAAATERTYEYKLSLALSKGSASTDIECRLVLRTIPSRPELNGVRRHDAVVTRTAVPTRTPTREPSRPALVPPTSTPVPTAPRVGSQPAAPIVASPFVTKPTNSAAPASSQPAQPAGAPTRVPTKAPVR